MRSNPIAVIFTEPEERRGRDPLGFLALLGRKREEILPGTTGSTSKAWYYLICYIYDRLKDCEKNKVLFRKKLDVLFLKSNLGGDETRIIGRQKKKLFKQKKLKKILKHWIKTTSYDYYWASYKRLFKDKNAESAPIDVYIIRECSKYNKLKSIDYLMLNKNHRKIKEWLKKYLIPANKQNKLNQFYNHFVKKHKNAKDKEELIRNAFIKNIFNSQKRDDALKDIPVIEAFLWAYEAIFKIVLNLINRRKYSPNNITSKTFNCGEARKFLKNWNKKLENMEDSEKTSEDSDINIDTSKDRPPNSKVFDFNRELTDLISFVNYIKSRHGDVFEELKKELGTWVDGSGSSLCDKILQHHFELKQVSVFIKKNKKGEWALTTVGEKNRNLPYFPKHYYGILSYMYLIDDIEK